MIGDDSMTETSAPTQTGTDRFVIDARSSRFTVRAFATGLLAAMGHNPTIGIRDFTGELKFDPDKLEASSLKIIVKSSSLSVQDDISAKDLHEMERLMNQEVLETAKYPEVLYEASNASITKMAENLYSAALKGTLTLHGVSRSQPVNVRVALLGSMLRA
jgi:polyisoprenoid-binding protein YceI